MSEAAALVDRVAALAREQRMEEALEAAQDAARREPNNVQAAISVAQLSFETWRPASALFEKARALAPQNLDLVRNHALALAAEDASADAERILADALDVSPFWLDGHRTLATLRITAGDGDSFDRSYRHASGIDGAPLAFWMGWFQLFATLKRWDAARQIVDAAKKAKGEHRTLEMAALYLESEAGSAVDLSRRFAQFAGLGDPGLDLCHVRHLLRRSAISAAAEIAERHVARPSARLFWPYLSLCWRLQTDARAQWLDGDPAYAAKIDLDLIPAAQSELAAVLRGLHRLKAPYPEQSVRGGTQTDRHLLFHPHPLIQSLRKRFLSAVRDFIASWPSPQPNHPLLSPRRDQVHFEGSWSVRLAGAGYHSPHTHVHGWVSSAYYVDLPEAGAMGAPPAGWLSLGTPPPELGLDLAPTRRIEPKPSRLALFPSTMWHSTEPFESGERLTIAFDVRLPR